MSFNAERYRNASDAERLELLREVYTPANMARDFPQIYEKVCPASEEMRLIFQLLADQRRESDETKAKLREIQTQIDGTTLALSLLASQADNIVTILERAMVKKP
jgi:hypothetical protein